MVEESIPLDKNAPNGTSDRTLALDRDRQNSRCNSATALLFIGNALWPVRPRPPHAATNKVFGAGMRACDRVGAEGNARCGRKLLECPVQMVEGAGNVSIAHERRQRVAVQRRRPRRMSCQRLQSSDAKTRSLPAPAVKQRLFAKAVAGERQRSLALIPKCEGKLAGKRCSAASRPQCLMA